MAGKFVQGNWLLPNNVNANKQSNYSLSFTGLNSSDYIISNDALITGNQSRSISVWAKSSQSLTSNNNQVPFSLGTGSIGNRTKFAIKIRGSQRVQIDAKSYSVDFDDVYAGANWGSIDLNDGQWHHYVVTYATDDLKLYVDGTFIAGSTNFNSLVTQDGALIGVWYRNGSFADHFPGQIDEVSVFSRVLSSGEVSSLYNSGTPGNPFDLSGDPIAYYKLGETAIFQNTAYSGNIFQVPNHAQSQFSWQMQTGTSLRLAPATTPKQLGTTHTLSTWLNANVSTASGFFYSLSNINSGSIQTQATTPYSGLVINDNGAYVSSSTQDIRYRVNNVDLIFTIPANIDVTDGNWHNVILVRTGGTAKCYLDGQEIANPTGSLSSTEEFSFELISSTSKGGATPQWPGKISNFAIWKSDQSANKDNIYNNGDPQSVYTTTPDYWWKLDNSSTTNVLSNLVSKNSSISTYPYSERCIVMAGGLSYNNSGGGPSLMFANEVNLGESNSISIWMSGFDIQDQYINNGHIYGGVNQYKWGIFGNTNGSFIVAKFNNATTWKLWYYLGTNAGEYVELTIDQSTYPSVFTTIISSNFYNLLFVRDGNNLEVFFNNSSVGTGTFTLGESTNTLVNAIGRDGNNTSTPANNGYKMGKSLALDDVTLFNKALSASERNTLYNNGKPGDNTSLSPTAWIRMGDDIDVTNNRLIDYSGNGNYVNFSNWDQFYVRDIESVTSIGDTSVSLALAATDLGLYNPLYSQFSTWFPAGAAVDTNFTLPAYTKYSYSFWYKKTTSTTFSGDRTIIGNLKEGSGANVDTRGVVMLSSENIQVMTGNGSVQYSNSSFDVSSLLLDQDWHHVALTWINGQIELFIDGSLENTYTDSNIVTGSAAEATTKLGRLNTQYSKFLTDSLIDEFAIFDKQLSNTEIISIYNNGKPTSLASHSPVQWWRLGDTGYATTAASNSTLTYPNEISGQPNGVTTASMQPSINADAPGVTAPGSSSGLVELDKEGDAPNSTSNAISYNILKTDQSIYTPKYVSQYTVDNNYSMAFDGTGYISLGSSLDFGTVNTICCWVYKTANNCTLTGDTGNNNDYNIFSGQTQVYYRVGSPYAYWNYTLPLSTWVHFAFVRNGTYSIDFYANGVKQNRVNNPGFTINTKIDTIGDKSNGSHDGGSAPWIGNLDEFAVFNEALTADQIKFDIYGASATANKSADFINNPNLPNPVAWYRMGD